jgi:hypothetical protein
MLKNGRIQENVTKSKVMQAFFRQVVAPILIVLVFLVALAATSARIFLPDDMVTPAPSGVVPSLSHSLDFGRNSNSFGYFDGKYFQ